MYGGRKARGMEQGGSRGSRGRRITLVQQRIIFPIDMKGVPSLYNDRFLINSHALNTWFLLLQLLRIPHNLQLCGLCNSCSSQPLSGSCCQAISVDDLRGGDTAGRDATFVRCYSVHTHKFHWQHHTPPSNLIPTSPSLPERPSSNINTVS